MIDGLRIIIISNPFLWTLVVMWISALFGMLIGAWWNSRPLSDLEQRVIHHQNAIYPSSMSSVEFNQYMDKQRKDFDVRESDEHGEGL